MTNVATVAKVAYVAIVAIANAYKCQWHRHHHHDEYTLDVSSLFNLHKMGMIKYLLTVILI